MRTTFAPAQRRIQNPPLHAFLNLRGLLISRDLLDHIQRCNHQCKADHEHNKDIADESGDQVGDEGNSCNGDDVGQLRGDMGDMLTLCTGGSHDRRIGDGGAVVAADGTTMDAFSKAHRGSGVGSGEYIFEHVPVGTSEISWDNSFGFDLTLYEEEGEPEWS